MRRPAFVLWLALAGSLVWPALPSWSSAQGAPVGGSVVFEGAGDTILRLEGHGSYRGSLEVVRAATGVSVINELDLESYVMGIKEVPGSWPVEALKAQAVAARTYVLWEIHNEIWTRHGFDVCATVACQVYSGVQAERGPEGRRWVEAVRATAGEVLLEGGEPILARYHASSGGRTLPNEFVYPSSGPRGYLEGVDDPADAVSPLHTWTVDFTREAMERILREGVGLAGNLVEIRNDQDARTALVRTEGGELEMNSVRLRRVVSEHAPRLYPDLYPAPRPDGLRMPLTLPSSRFDVETTSEGFRFHGRGYGHGVGMSQWGAKGRAEEGETYDAILAAYYGGLTPATAEVPDRIRVAVARRTGEARISGDGAFSVATGGDVLAESTLGAWTVTPGDGRTLLVQAPEGHELPLVLSGVSAPEEVVVDPPSTETLDIEFVVPKPAEVEAVLLLEGEEMSRVGRVFEAGTGRLRFPLTELDLPRRGEYRVELTASDGFDEVHDALEVAIVLPAGGRVVPGIVAVLVLAGAAAILFRRRSDGGGRPSVEGME